MGNNKKTPEELLLKLGVTHCTQRHITIIQDYLDAGRQNAGGLLIQLGSYDDNDLKITEAWLNEIL